MAEVFGVVASVIAVFQAADRVMDCLNTVKEAPKVLESLNWEIANARSSIANIYPAAVELAERVPPKRLEPVQALLLQYHADLTELEEVTLKCFSQKTTADGTSIQSKPRRLSWARQESRIRRLQENIRTWRMMVLGELSTLAALDHLRTNGLLEQKQIRVVELDGSTDTRKATDATETIELDAVIPLPTSTKAPSLPRSKQWSQKRHLTACEDCKCDCHLEWAAETPARLSSIFGQLLIRTRVGRACSLASCAQRSPAAVAASYFLPKWLASRAVLLRLISGPQITAELTIPRVVSPDSDLFRYIQTGDSESIVLLLRNAQASPQDIVVSRYGTITALLFALNCCQYDACRLLIQWGADPQADNATKLTSSPADMAWNMIKECQYDETQSGLEAIFPLPADLDRRAFTPIHKLVIGLTYGSLGDTISSSLPDLETGDLHGRRPIHWAAWRGNIEAVTALLAAGADPNTQDPAGRTPVHFTAMTCSSECTALLVEAGGDPDITDEFMETPLHLASASARLSNMKYLLDAGVNINSANLAGSTPLISAVLSGSLEAVETLLAHKASLECTDTNGDTALTLSIWSNAPSITRVLAQAGARLDVVNGRGNTVLHLAAEYGSVQVMEVLMETRLFVDPVAQNKDGLTAMDIVRQRRGDVPELVEALGALLVRAIPRRFSAASGVDVTEEHEEGATGEQRSGMSEDSVVFGMDILTDFFDDGD